jgi:hypothetical protein
VISNEGEVGRDDYIYVFQVNHKEEINARIGDEGHFSREIPRLGAALAVYRWARRP